MKKSAVTLGLIFYSLCAIGADIDNDGVPDETDALPYDESEFLDTDSDGYGDNSDDFPFDPEKFRDADKDGVADESDERAAGDFFGEGATNLGEDPLLLLEYDSSDYNNLEPDRHSLAVFEGHLYFAAYDSEKRHALMRYDGETITKIFQIESNSTAVSKLAVVNQQLYFIAGDQFNASYGRGNLYKFNGTDVNLEIENIERQYQSPKLGYAVMSDGTIFFEADLDDAGPELWKKTPTGELFRITDFNTNNSFNYGSSIDGTMCSMNDTLFFSVSTSNTSDMPEGIYSFDASSDQPVLELAGVTYIKNCAENDTSLFVAHLNGIHSSPKVGDGGRIWTRPFFQTHSGGLGTPDNSGDVINHGGEIFAWLYGGDKSRAFAPYYFDLPSEQFVESQPFEDDKPYFSSADQTAAFFIRSSDQAFFFRGKRNPFEVPAFEYGDHYYDLYSFSKTERPRKRRELVSNVSNRDTQDIAPTAGIFYAGDVYVVKKVQNDNRSERFLLKQISIGQDRDMDGVDDSSDAFPLDPTKSSDTVAPTLNAISIDRVTVDVSEEPQSITVTVDASDESGIDWDGYSLLKQTQLVFQDAGGGYHYAKGSNENPGTLTLSIDDNDVGGNWRILRLQLTDVHGNRASFSDLSSFGMPDSINIIGGKESDPPTLNAISIDKVTVDVAEEPQTITVNVDASDESGINWEDRFDTILVFQDSGGGYHYARGSNDNPGVLQITIDNEDVDGEWEIKWLKLADVYGNSTIIRKLSDYGLPDYLYILRIDEPTSDISLSYSGLYETLGKNYDYEMLVTAENHASEATSSLDLNISTKNIRVTSVSREDSSQACSLTAINYDSTVSCSTSAIAGNSSAVFRVAVTAGETGSSWLNLKLVGDTPDISLLDNYVYVASTIETSVDSDNDGISDQIDAFPLDPEETTDTDGDGIGNNTDSDDDGDGVADDEDAFPLDSTESLDSDSDGIGNNADTDDDGDGVSDSSDAFPLDASEALDTDGDGVGNNSDTDDDGDGVDDSSDAFPLNANESADTDGDGVGNNSDTDDDGDGYSDSEESLAGTDPLDSNSYPDTPEEEAGGTPIWMLYTATKIAAERSEPVGAPSIGKCDEDIFGRVDCNDSSAISLPYSSSGSQSISRLPKPAFFSFGTYVLSAESANYRVAELTAEDRNGRVSPDIDGLDEGQVINQGQSIQFELLTPPTNGQQTNLRFFLRFEGDSGQPCDNCTFSFERVFTSN